MYLLYFDIKAEMKKKIEELVGNPSAKKYGLKSRAKFELAEKKYAFLHSNINKNGVNERGKQ